MFQALGLSLPGSSVSAPQHVSYLPALGSSKQLNVGSTSGRIGLSPGIRGIRLVAREASIRFTVGTYNVVASTTDHYLEVGSTFSLLLRENEEYIAAVRAEEVDGALEISELL